MLQQQAPSSAVGRQWGAWGWAMCDFCTAGQILPGSARILPWAPKTSLAQREASPVCTTFPPNSGSPLCPLRVRAAQWSLPESLPQQEKPTLSIFSGRSEWWFRRLRLVLSSTHTGSAQAILRDL